MAFVLPTFNLPYKHWWPGTDQTDPPDVEGMCQLRGPSHTALTAQASGLNYSSPCALFPAGEDIRRPQPAPIGDSHIEIPADSGRFYLVLNVDDIAKGFTNEHRYCTLFPEEGWPTPYP